MSNYVTSPQSSTKPVAREPGDTRPPTVRERIARKLALLPVVDANACEITAVGGDATDTVTRP